MEHLRLSLQIITVISGLCTLLGILKPWYVLWWLPRQNRLMVLLSYGLTFLLSLVIILLIR